MVPEQNERVLNESVFLREKKIIKKKIPYKNTHTETTNRKERKRILSNNGNFQKINKQTKIAKIKIIIKRSESPTPQLFGQNDNAKSLPIFKICVSVGNNTWIFCLIVVNRVVSNLFPFAVVVYLFTNYFI